MFIDILDDFLEEPVFKVLIDRGDGFRGLLFLVFRNDRSGKADQEELQRCDHNVTAEIVMVIRPGNEMVDDADGAAAAREDRVQHICRQWPVHLEDDCEIGAGVCGGDALVMKLAGAVKHGLLALISYCFCSTVVTREP